jgi:hypothetical protein
MEFLNRDCHTGGAALSRDHRAAAKELDDLELASVAKVIAMSTPKEYVAYYKRVKGLGVARCGIARHRCGVSSEVRGFDESELVIGVLGLYTGH